MKKIALKIFKYRSYTPIPFLILMVVFQKADITSIVIGFSIALLGEFFRLWGVSYAGSETRTTNGVGGTFLVVSGAFAYLRNPLYLGNMLMYLGIGIMSMALFPYLQIFALLFFFWQYTVIIKEEESFLQTKYGKSYKDYCAVIPKLIPSFKKYKNPGLEQPEYQLQKGLRSERRTLQAFSLIVLIIIIRYVLSLN
ncbi:MAG: isoprenylcysteine carboxylmethyltransferase family protein [Ignavibacteriales bacterium]|nr:isoprenylcysteine carboxylmethyltransferase family protein [Ignavibacteriales bacterium]